MEEGTPERVQVAWTRTQARSHGLCMLEVPPAVHFVALVAKLCLKPLGNPGRKA